MWWKEQCDEIEKLDRPKQGRIDLKHWKLKKLTKERMPMIAINDRDVNKLTSRQALLGWHCTKFYIQVLAVHLHSGETL